MSMECKIDYKTLYIFFDIIDYVIDEFGLERTEDLYYNCDIRYTASIEGITFTYNDIEYTLTVNDLELYLERK